MAAVGEAPQTSGVSSDSNELAGFGYKQELDRSLGSFSAFAAGFSYISILTGVTALFATGYFFAGPGVWWTWPVVVAGQALVALCFMEMAGQYPIAGSVYQWGKQISGSLASWMTGWMYLIGAIVTIMSSSARCSSASLLLPFGTSHARSNRVVDCACSYGSPSLLMNGSVRLPWHSSAGVRCRRLHRRM